jgi:pimeloyl-ACP methyl ester carboxylesterase
VHRWGRGPRVVLVHGSVLGGRHAWRAQRPLTEHWTLLAPDRPGHGDTPADGRTDFERDGALIAEQLLDEPAHVARAPVTSFPTPASRSTRTSNKSSGLTSPPEPPR